MSRASLHAGGDTWRLEGELSFETVPGLFTSARQAMHDSIPSSVDLGSVERVESAGVALMLDWIRAARVHGRTLSFDNIPEHMQSIAALCGVDHLFRQ